MTSCPYCLGTGRVKCHDCVRGPCAPAGLHGVCAVGVLGTPCACSAAALPRVLVCGGRAYQDRQHVRETLDAVLDKLGPFVLVHGACNCGPEDPDQGADRFARDWALEHQVAQDPYPADWEHLGKRAGPVRNGLMAESCLTGAIVFPGGRGTADMRRRCHAAEVPTWIR